MKQKLIIFALLVACGWKFAYSQSVTETRQIKTTAIEIYEKYVGVMANLDDGDVYNEDNFLELFDENTTLYNDILPANDPQQVSPKEYFDKFVQNVKKYYAEYRNLDFGFPTSNGEKWEIKCTFSNDIRFKTQIDNYYPKWSLNYTMTIEMDKHYNQTYKVFENAKIKSIEVAEPLTDFIIIENPQNIKIKYNDNVIVDYEGNSNNKIFPNGNIKNFEIIEEENSYFFNPLETQLKQKQSDEHFYYPECEILPKNIIEIGFNHSPVNFGNKITSENFDDITLKSNAISLLSFLFGKQIAHKKNTTWFFNVGLDLNWYNYEYNGTNYTEYQSMDTDNDPYLRKIWINSLNEKINRFSLSVPLSVEYVLQLTKKTKNPIFLSFELGGFAEYTLLLQNSYKINANYHALYDYYGGVEFDHYYDYGNFDQSNKQTLATIKDLRYDYGAFGKFGFWLAIDKNNLLKINIGYKHSFNKPLKYKDDFVISKDKNSYQSLLQSTNQGMQNLFWGISYVRTIRTKQNKIK